MATTGGSENSIYFALTGDIVGSRDVPDRADTQRALRMLVGEVNEGLPPEDVVAPLRFTAGDEVQCLLTTIRSVTDVLIHVADGLPGLEVRWGLGAGFLTTDIALDVGMLDGPCFHRARSALSRASRDGVWLRVDGIASPFAHAIEAMFRFMGTIRRGWTPTQARYARAVRGRLQKDVARRFDVDESTVSRVLRSARFAEVEEGERAARKMLAWLASRPELLNEA